MTDIFAALDILVQNVTRADANDMRRATPAFDRAFRLHVAQNEFYRRANNPCLLAEETEATEAIVSEIAAKQLRTSDLCVDDVIESTMQLTGWPRLSTIRCVLLAVIRLNFSGHFAAFFESQTGKDFMVAANEAPAPDVIGFALAKLSAHLPSATLIYAISHNAFDIAQSMLRMSWFRDRISLTHLPPITDAIKQTISLILAQNELDPEHVVLNISERDAQALIDKLDFTFNTYEALTTLATWHHRKTQPNAEELKEIALQRHSFMMQHLRSMSQIGAAAHEKIVHSVLQMRVQERRAAPRAAQQASHNNDEDADIDDKALTVQKPDAASDEVEEMLNRLKLCSQWEQVAPKNVNPAETAERAALVLKTAELAMFNYRRLIAEMQSIEIARVVQTDKDAFERHNVDVAQRTEQLRQTLETLNEADYFG